MSDNLKKLTGKNPKDFEPVAYSLINNSDSKLFAELVSKEDFLFDFVKQNVSNRLKKYCNQSNYLNLLHFLKFYSPSYEDFIISTLVEFADEDLTDKLLELFETGTEDEKTYCAKFFSYIQDSLALDFLRENAYSSNYYLATNCASTLGILKDEQSYHDALKKLQNSDDFTKTDAVKFLVSYGDKQATPEIIKALKNSSVSENIAGELPYLSDLFYIFEQNSIDALFVFNCIINGLGEILGLSQIFDFQLFEFIKMITQKTLTPEIAVVLLNAQDKFETLTENDEYLFDDSKETKEEVYKIKDMLSLLNSDQMSKIAENELRQESEFVLTALDFTKNADKVRELLSSKNPTLVLKALDVLKKLEILNTDDKATALNNIDNEDLKFIINAM